MKESNVVNVNGIVATDIDVVEQQVVSGYEVKDSSPIPDSIEVQSCNVQS